MIEAESQPQARDRAPIASIALISAAALGYELLLTRIFAVIHWHHFAYAMISLALLGFGASGTALALLRTWALRHYRPVFIACAWLFSLSTVFCTAAAERVPFRAEALLWDPWQPLWLTLTYLLLATPFFWMSTAVALALTYHRERAGRVYAADLVGAGLGSAALLGALCVMLPESALVLIAGSAAFAVMVSALELRASRPLWLALGAAAAIVVAAVPRTWLTPLPSTYKSLAQALRVPETLVIAERSSPLGRISVIESPAVPLRHAPGLSLNSVAEPPAQLGLFRDGDQMDAITTHTNDDSRLAFLRESTASLPYAIATPRAVLVLGAGGGLEVLRALEFGASTVDAVELDRQVVRLVRDDYADVTGGLYSHPGVAVHVSDVRGFLTHSTRGFDLVQLALLGGAGSGAGGLGGLNEDYLHTVEAVRLYLDRLAPGGWFTVTRWIQLPPRDSLKLIATLVTALEARGVSEPGTHLVGIRSWQTMTLMVKNEPVTTAEIAAVRAFCERLSFDAVWYPGVAPDETNRYHELDEPYEYEGTLAMLGTSRAEFLRDYQFDVRPATDDRPYFQNFFRWKTLGEALGARGRGGMALLEAGYLILVLTLGQALIAGLVLIVLPLMTLRRERDAAAPGSWRTIAYFGAIGLAFLFIEIAFLQKLIRFLHHPTVALAVVLASFLVFAGAGSAASAARDAAGSGHRLRYAVIAIVAIGVLQALGLDALFDLVIDWPLPARAVFASLLIAPLAFAMGMPLPLGIASLPQRLVPWAWGINACASVVSAPLATLLAVHFGFQAVLWSAIAIYAIAAAFAPRCPSVGSRRAGWRTALSQ